MNPALFTYGRYTVQVINNHIEDGMPMMGYGVIHSTTGVVELSSTLLFHAMKWAKICEDSIVEQEHKLLESNQMELWPTEQLASKRAN